MFFRRVQCVSKLSNRQPIISESQSCTTMSLLRILSNNLPQLGPKLIPIVLLTSPRTDFNRAHFIEVFSLFGVYSEFLRGGRMECDLYKIRLERESQVQVRKEEKRKKTHINGNPSKIVRRTGNRFTSYPKEESDRLRKLGSPLAKTLRCDESGVEV